MLNLAKERLQINNAVRYLLRQQQLMCCSKIDWCKAAVQMALQGQPGAVRAMPPDLAMATSAGWAWALVILGALKLGRRSAEQRALDYGHLEVRV